METGENGARRAPTCQFIVSPSIGHQLTIDIGWAASSSPSSFSPPIRSELSIAENLTFQILLRRGKSDNDRNDASICHEADKKSLVGSVSFIGTTRPSARFSTNLSTYYYLFLFSNPLIHLQIIRSGRSDRSDESIQRSVKLPTIYYNNLLFFLIFIFFISPNRFDFNWSITCNVMRASPAEHFVDFLRIGMQLKRRHFDFDLIPDSNPINAALIKLGANFHA